MLLKRTALAFSCSQICTLGLGDGCNSYLVLDTVEPANHITHEKMKCLLNKDIYITEHILFGYFEQK